MSSTMDRVDPDEGILFACTAADILVSSATTGGAFSLLRIAQPPGCWTPPHLHRNEDETLFVLSGTVRVERAGHAVDIGPGQVVMLPRGQAHRLGNVAAEEASCLVLCTPGGFDGFVRDAGRAMPDGGPVMTEADIDRLVQAAPRYGIVLLAEDALGAPAPVDRDATGA